MFWRVESDWRAPIVLADRRAAVTVWQSVKPRPPIQVQRQKCQSELRGGQTLTVVTAIAGRLGARSSLKRASTGVRSGAKTISKKRKKTQQGPLELPAFPAASKDWHPSPRRQFKGNYSPERCCVKSRKIEGFPRLDPPARVAAFWAIVTVRHASRCGRFATSMLVVNRHVVDAFESAVLCRMMRECEDTAKPLAQPAIGCQSRPKSSETAEWVSAPTLMRSTPVSAIFRTVSRSTPPDASS